MVIYLDFRLKKDAPVLKAVMGALYIPEHEYNPLSFLKKGSVIWYDNKDDTYSVFELQETYINEQEPLSDFIKRLIDSINQRR